MIRSLRRTLGIYGAIAAIVPKEYLAYNIWVWMEFVVQILSMTIFVYFWRAVYASTSTLGGLNLQQTLNYILLAQVLAPIVETRVVFQFGFLVRNGQIAIELLRPLDFQMRYFVESLTSLVIFAFQKSPLLLIAWLFFGLQLPADPLTWLVFAISLVLGQSILFFFDWIFACLAFYSTETWGLSVVRVGVATFFSGALLPLTMMPGWLQDIAAALPFAQAIYVPTSFLSGINSPANAPQVWLVQLVWLIALGLLSRWLFNIAVRQVTVQGG
ncbi:MAG: ABC transporter permease [Acidobacteriota bacterium]